MPKFTIHLPAVLYFDVDVPDAAAAQEVAERVRRRYAGDGHDLSLGLRDPQGVPITDPQFEAAGPEWRPTSAVDVVPL